ncbi:MAG TPA: PQQ-dependent sugar dehydrogenase [Vicinamibacterales bacterium]|nr:PQQ-dependent sugar dehydrogenase [Vicinamibacterales bacterium]
MRLTIPAFVLVATTVMIAAPPTAPQLTLELKDFATLPITGDIEGTGQVDGMLARVNSVREEPGGTGRLFVTDMNGPIYILDKNTKALTTYLDFNGSGDRAGIFDRLYHDPGYSSGVSQFQFDPDYRRNGKFYTVHMEAIASVGSQRPDTTKIPGLSVGPFGYEPTAAVTTPGPITYESILIEWTDSNLRNLTFEGTAREVLRVQLNHRIHPLGEVVFHPTAQRGDPEWRVMYIGIGDGGAGETRTIARPNPQRLDTLVGKILRIIPDPAEHANTSTPSENGRYRIPNDNPFVAKAGAKKEIWAYGLRNPHRLSWAADPADARRQYLIAAVIGLRTWEMVSIIRKGANYGYSQREGNQLLQPDNVIAPLPAVDNIAVQIGDDLTDEVVVPTYPVVQYGHVPTGGDGIGSGYVYTGKALPALRGKYLFSDLSTGRVWYAEWKDMLAADDGNPATLAEMHEVKLRWNNAVHGTFTTIAQAAYQSRGGKDPDLPGRGTVSGSRRADARFALDAAGELFVYSKTDGMIRQVVGVK